MGKGLGTSAKSQSNRKPGKLCAMELVARDYYWMEMGKRAKGDA